MTSIWAVESGDYEEYSIDVVFSNEAAANEYVEKMNAIDHDETRRVSEWGVEDTCPEFYPSFLLSAFEGTRTTNICARSEDELHPLGMARQDPVELTVAVKKYGPGNNKHVLSVEGPDRDEVCQVFLDKIEELGW